MSTINSKQTAVQYLKKMVFPYLTHDEKMLVGQFFYEAEVMEKEHNEYFFNCGRNYQLTGEGTFTETYNETYGK